MHNPLARRFSCGLILLLVSVAFSAHATTFYVDSACGNNAYDGLSNVVTNGHGPKLNIGPAISLASSGDVIVAAAGIYQEFQWDLGAKALVLDPQGMVTVYQSDPSLTDSDGDGIPDLWEVRIGSDAFTYDAYQANTNASAHYLTNFQVYQHPSVLLSDGYSTLGDGLPDWWKLIHGFVLTDPGVAYADVDGDGYINLQEYNFGTDPQDAANYPNYLPPDFAGWWKFDEGNGTDTVSTVGTNLTGKRTGDPLPAWCTGVTSNALAFDGAQNEVVVANVAQLSPTNALAITAWVKTATNMTSEVVAKWSTNTASGSYILSLTNGQVSLELMLTGSYTVVVGGASSLSDTNWHHIAGTYDGAEMRVYLDGTSVGALAASGTVDVVDAPLRLGLLMGELDDVRLYNYALPPNAIAALRAADSDEDGMPDIWEANHGLNSLNAADAMDDPDGDGFTNWQEYQAGTDPRNPNSHPNSRLIIPNAWAVYVSSNSVQISADVRSTNVAVNVKAAECFLNAITGTNGTGTAMFAADGAFNSTNETAVATFTPTFPYGERHVIYLHAKGQDGQWTPFKQVILNPNINDLLAKVKANYSQIQDITFTTTVKEIIEGETMLTQTVLFRQKGPYKMRWDNQTTGATTIVNGNEIAFIDPQGRITPVSLIVNDGVGLGKKRTHLFWNTDQFAAEHSFSSLTVSTNAPATYQCGAAPQAGVFQPYDSISFTVDHRNGVVTETEQAQSGTVVFRTEQPSPQEVAPGVWFQSQQNWIMPVDEGWDIRHNEEIQMQSIQINTAISDDLFEF